MERPIMPYVILTLAALACTVHPMAANEAGVDVAKKDGDAKRFKLAGGLTAGGETIETSVCFDRDHAVSFVADEADAVFNLRELWWQDVDSGKRMTLEQCKLWHAESKQKTESSLANVKDDGLRSFLTALTQPEFEIGEVENGFVMKNPVLEYVIQPVEKLTAARGEMLTKYNRLVAYHTAIIARKMPPDPALAVSAELEKRGVYPKRMKVTVTTPKGKQALTFDLTLQPLTKEDSEAIAEALEGVARRSAGPATKQ